VSGRKRGVSYQTLNALNRSGMSDTSIVPERQLVFSPGLAATIGLEEAVLLQHLQELFQHRASDQRDGQCWLTVERDYLLRSLPFWQALDLHRVSRSLADKGVILIDSPPLHSASQLRFCINEGRAANRREQAAAAAPASPASRAPAAHAPERPARARLLPPNWTPREDLLQLLALNHNIPRDFALGQLEDFIFYWRERGETGHAWENRFRQHVLRQWRQRQAAGGFEPPEEAPLDNEWRPHPDALEILHRNRVDADFIEEAIPEFILYWRERGTPPRELNSRFIQHIRIQWARYTQAVQHSTEPTRIDDDWYPAADVFDILELSHIDLDFARSLIPEFIVYWRDSNQAHTSWNTKFLQHVKYHWARRHQIDQAGHGHDSGQGTHRTGRTRDRSIREDLTDTSWAG